MPPKPVTYANRSNKIMTCSFNYATLIKYGKELKILKNL